MKKIIRSIEFLSLISNVKRYYKIQVGVTLQMVKCKESSRVETLSSVGDFLNFSETPSKDNLSSNNCKELYVYKANRYR